MNTKNNNGNVYMASLCWTCSKASGGFGCPWIDKKPSGSEPVKGWKISTRIQRVSTKPEPQIVYVVKYCPLYKEDENEIK